MKKILQVDDDAVVLEIYRQKFVSNGFEVETATDGLEAVRSLSSHQPDLVVLDLMMPRLSGMDVLKFIRSRPALEPIPVVILTNTFMGVRSQAAGSFGVERAISKTECTPAKLLAIANDVIAGNSAETTPPPPPPADTAESGNQVREAFLANTSVTLATLRDLYTQFLKATDDTACGLRLDNFYRKVHYITALAGLAQCPDIALLCGAFEALLFELREKPHYINPSSLRTISQAIDFLGVLFEGAQRKASSAPLKAEVLVVDDDPLSNRLVVAALSRAHLKSRATENPLLALELLKHSHYDLVLLDVEMPHMTGFDLCRRLRSLPGYAQTPVIYVTSRNDFESRALSSLTTGTDLIAKPVFAIELAVKAVTHLIQSRRS